MITINGKEYRNLQEQVLENMDEIESLKNKEADDLLATGIAAGQVLTADGNGGAEWAPGSSEEAVQAPVALSSGNVVVGTTGGDRNVATLAAGALGDVLTQGAGAPVWAPLNVEGEDVKATGATAGKVLTSDGSGGAAWVTNTGGAEAVQAPSTLVSGNVVIGTTGGDRNVATLAAGTSGYVLTQGVGAPTWAAPSVEGTSVKSTGETSGKVLTADGSGGAAWAAAGGGSGDVTASGTLSVGAVMVGLGSKTITSLNGSNGKILGWNGGAVWQDPPKVYCHNMGIRIKDASNNLYTLMDSVYSTQSANLVTDVSSLITYIKKYAELFEDYGDAQYRVKWFLNKGDSKMLVTEVGIATANNEDLVTLTEKELSANTSTGVISWTQTKTGNLTSVETVIEYISEV